MSLVTCYVLRVTAFNMYTVSKTFTFSYGHRLLHDAGRCRHLHGHTGRATIVLARDALDANGMVCHFDRLKETIGTWIHDTLDHALLLNAEDPLTLLLRDANERFLPMEGNPTAERIAELIFDQARTFNLPIHAVEVWESETSKATVTT